MPLLSRQGPLALSLDDVAARAGVTRNLLYHYFPGGRGDLVTAVVEEAEAQLLEPPATADLTEDSLQGALARILDHALAPTHAWRVHRMARAAGLSGASETVERSSAHVVRHLARLQHPGRERRALSEVALRGYLAFAEEVLDEGRTAGIGRSEIRRLLEQMWHAAVRAE